MTKVIFHSCALRHSIVLGWLVSTGCLATDVAPSGTSSGTSSTSSSDTSSSTDTTVGAINLDDCDTLLTEPDCAAADTEDPGGCTWIEARVTGAACASDAVVGQCVGLTYVGEGCQALPCPGRQTDDIDAFYRTVDGSVQVFESPQCGLVPVDGWVSCTHVDGPTDCLCLCPA